MCVLTFENALHHVSLPIFSEITGESVNKLRKMYRGYISSETIPLSLLPLEHQDSYTKEYLLRDRLLDLDLLHLVKDYESALPLQSKEVQAFFKETALVRQAVHITAAYAADVSITRRLTELAVVHGISYRTLVRKRSIFMNQSSLMKLLDNPSLTEDVHDRYHTCCFYARDFIIFRHFHTGRPSGNSILRELRKAAPLPCSQCPYHPDNKNTKHRKGDFIPQATCCRQRDFIRIPNGKDTVNLIISRIPKQETCLAWEGVRSWASKYHYTPARKKPTVVNQVWFSDHHLLDVFVITGKHSNGSPKSERVWLTGVLDAATNALVGYALSLHPNSFTIAEAFARACAFKVDCRYCGLPEYFYIDNGKDYNANTLKGLSRSQESPLYLNKEFSESGILEWFGIKVIHALPYRGCSKTIERIWKTIEDEWISKLPGYCGGSVATRPVTLVDDRKHGQLYTYQQFADNFSDFIYPAYNSFSQANEAPDALYDQLPKFNSSVPTWRTLAVLKSYTQMRTVHRDGIHFQNRKYWCVALAPFIESATKVRIFAFDAPFNRTISVVMGSVYIGEAHLIDNLNLIEERRFRIIQHLQEQRMQFKTVSKHIKAVHFLMLQSDILGLTSDVPPIDHITYVQEIDANKDNTPAENDPRIPDELKEKAIQYLNLTAEKPEEPGVASQFFHVLGGRTNTEGMLDQ